MKGIVNRVLNFSGFHLIKSRYPKRYFSIYERYKEFTMTPAGDYLENLHLVDKYVNSLNGDVAECGVWRGGMSAGIAELLGKNRQYFLFDSFEGLPQAKEIDGPEAIHWQNNLSGDFYYDNCKAEISFAQTAMSMTGSKYKLIQGWFNETMPQFDNTNSIALLRLDGDWYESIQCSLKYLFPKVVKGGVIIIDDYFSWDGCSRAVHDYLSSISSVSRIKTSEKGGCYIIKQD
jgi:O-methyltransferase